MGEGTKRSNAKSFRQELVAAGSEATFEGGLLAAQSVDQELVLSCIATSSEAIPDKGQLVNLIDRNKASIEVIHETQIVGHVNDSGTALLRDEVKIQEFAGKRLSATVIQTKPAFGKFSVRLVELL